MPGQRSGDGGKTWQPVGGPPTAQRTGARSRNEPFSGHFEAGKRILTGEPGRSDYTTRDTQLRAGTSIHAAFASGESILAGCLQANGRDDATQQLKQRSGAGRFVAVTGRSGSNSRKLGSGHPLSLRSSEPQVSCSNTDRTIPTEQNSRQSP